MWDCFVCVGALTGAKRREALVHVSPWQSRSRFSPALLVHFQTLPKLITQPHTWDSLGGTIGLLLATLSMRLWDLAECC